MKGGKDMAGMAGSLKCPECDETFQTQEELSEHNREFHSEEMNEGQEAGTGSEQPYPQTERNPGAERNPSFDKDQQSPRNPGGERKGPGSEQNWPEQEHREKGRKRAAS